MKLLATPFHLFGIFAFSSLASNHSTFVVSANDNNHQNDTSLATMEHPSEDLTTPMLDQQPPRSGHLSLLGLDPRIPLTKDEAAFLEATLRHVFNTVHKKEGIDLVADTVAIDGDFVEDTTTNTNNNNNNNLRGSDRKLRPSTDRERCWHDPFGPLKGQIIEDCCYDIEFYVDCYCDLCDDGYYSWVDDLLLARWDDVFDQPDVIINDDVFFQYTDDDIYANYIATAAPSAAPSASPSTSPTLAPTENEDDDEIDIALERGPQEPYIDPIAMQILFQLRRSPFNTFHHVTRVRFGGW